MRWFDSTRGHLNHRVNPAQQQSPRTRCLIAAMRRGSSCCCRLLSPRCGSAARPFGRRAARSVHGALATAAVRPASWVFAPAARRRSSIVLFVHGLGDQRETTPYYHRPWLVHLAREGYEVVYPAYERSPYQPGGLKHLVQGVASGAAARRRGRSGRRDRLLARRPAGRGLRERLVDDRARARRASSASSRPGRWTRRSTSRRSPGTRRC